MQRRFCAAKDALDAGEMPVRVNGRLELSSASDPVEITAVCVAGASLIFLLGLNLYLAGAPTFTNDFWFHLKMGEVYWTEGPWPSGDPMLHTARADAPIQHEWLFGIVVFAIERLFGFYGVRVFHFFAVWGTIWLAYSILRRACHQRVMVFLCTAIFCVLAFNRLFQLRPDLISIPATLLSYRLIIEPQAAPTRGRIWGFAALMLFWANLHSLFALGPILLFAALLGLVLQGLLERWTSSGTDEAEATRSFAISIALTIAVGIAISLLNPRGAEQHLTFFTSSRDAAIWAVKDEWSHFHPFEVSANVANLSPLLWLLVDLLFAGFASASLLMGWRCLVRRPNALGQLSPVLFGLGLASIVAGMLSIRFLWMAFFALLYLAHVIGGDPARLAPGRAGRQILSWSLALATLWVAVQFYRVGGYQNVIAQVPSGLRSYLTTPYISRKYHVEGVRFLRATGVRGNLFNSYGMGGFLGYWLSPSLRTFIDGRTEHYPVSVLADYENINKMRGRDLGMNYLDLLDRASVDLYFGIGLPTGPGSPERPPYTAANLENAQGWILVSRSFHHAIYLRDLPRNAANLDRISKYYKDEQIPFDRQNGLDVVAVLKQNADWAVAHEMLTEAEARQIRQRTSSNEKLRLQGLDTLAQIYTRLGRYRAAIALDREIARLNPKHKASLRRRILVDIKMDRPEEALEESWTLQHLDLDDSRSMVIHHFVTAYRDLSNSTRGRMDPSVRRIALDRLIRQFPLMTNFEEFSLRHSLPGQPTVD